MSVHTDVDINDVPNPGELPEEGWYHVRIAKVTEGESTTGNPKVDLQLKIQNEGPNTGRMIFDTLSLQAHALFALKAYYNAVGYKPARGQGHDPDNLLDCELWVKYDHKMVDGNPRGDIKSHNIKSLVEGPTPERGRPSRGNDRLPEYATADDSAKAPF